MIILRSSWCVAQTEPSLIDSLELSNPSELENLVSHRFDIVHPDDFDPGQDWTDVSNAAVRMLKTVLKYDDSQGTRAWMY